MNSNHQEQVLNHQINGRSQKALYIMFSYMLIFIMGCQADVTQQSYNITNGEVVDVNDPIADSTVVLYVETMTTDRKRTQIQNFCTGTIISKNVILTAAHCFVDFADMTSENIETIISKTRVGFEKKIFHNKQELTLPMSTLKKVSVHPLYKSGSVSTASKTPMWDVALVYLNEVIPTNAKIAKPILNKGVLKKGLEITLAGFGLLSTAPQVSASELMKVTVKIDNPLFTAAQFSYKYINGRGACMGDSGGPAYLYLPDGEIGVIGVTSWGDRFCRSLGAYTSIPSVSDWLVSELN